MVAALRYDGNVIVLTILETVICFFENLEKIYKLQLKAKARWNCLIALGFGCNLSLLSGFGVVVFVFLSFIRTLSYS
jgi:hypothetical protein